VSSHLKGLQAGAPSEYSRTTDAVIVIRRRAATSRAPTNSLSERSVSDFCYLIGVAPTRSRIRGAAAPGEKAWQVGLIPARCSLGGLPRRSDDEKAGDELFAST
jgi:hypothetical protein